MTVTGAAICSSLASLRSLHKKYENAAAPRLVMTAAGQIAGRLLQFVSRWQTATHGVIRVCVVLYCADSLRSVPVPPSQGSDDESYVSDVSDNISEDNASVTDNVSRQSRSNPAPP